jgi:hypothetical protein
MMVFNILDPMLTILEILKNPLLRVENIRG